MTKHATFVWSDHDIRNAIANNVIVVPETTKVIQPASLDIRPASTMWRLPASGLPGKKMTIKSYLHAYASCATQKFSNTILERNCVYIVELNAGLNLSPTISARANPKSSIGRLDVFVRLLTDYADEFDTVIDGYKGPLYAEVVPLTRPIMLDGSPLLQLRFRELLFNNGRDFLATTPDTPVTVDLKTTEENGGLIGYRFRREGSVIRLGDRDIPRFENWEPIYAKNETIILEPEAFYILASNEAVLVNVDEAAELTAYDVGLGEMRCHYAGFIDPGFGLNTDGTPNGSKLVLEVRGHDVPFMLRHGQRVGTLKHERLRSPATVPYGTGELGSNYQGQGLRLSKHFSQT